MIRTPGVSVFLCRDKDTTPLALRADVEYTHTLPEKVVIVTVETISIPHVETFDRCAVEVLGRGLFKVVHLTARFGYHDDLNIPDALVEARKQGLLERNLDLEHASYFVSRITITLSDSPGMQRWRKNLFIAMARNASSAIEHFGLPTNRTVILGSQVPL
jgi:KUP system potassium uptake protein